MCDCVMKCMMNKRPANYGSAGSFDRHVPQQRGFAAAGRADEQCAGRNRDAEAVHLVRVRPLVQQCAQLAFGRFEADNGVPCGGAVRQQTAVAADTGNGTVTGTGTGTGTDTDTGTRWAARVTVAIIVDNVRVEIVLPAVAVVRLPHRRTHHTQRDLKVGGADAVQR